jgi:hypothetical protein
VNLLSLFLPPFLRSLVSSVGSDSNLPPLSLSSQTPKDFLHLKGNLWQRPAELKSNVSGNKVMRQKKVLVFRETEVRFLLFIVAG